MKAILFDLVGVLFDESYLPIDKGFDLVVDCKQAGYALYICSNIHPLYLNELKEQHPDFFEQFEGIVIPARAGAHKPDPQIFQYVFTQHGLTPSETVFLDDSPTNVQAAQELGMRSIHVQDHDLLPAELAKAGILL